MLSGIARVLLKLGGWTMVGRKPDVDRAIVIAAPHTSNWDGIWAMIYKVALGLDIHFFAKHTLFWFPLGSVLRVLGGIPLKRREPGAALATAVNAFRSNDTFYFGLAPEGTRRATPFWKTGFYRIAMEADVPVILGFLDYGRRRIGLGPTLKLSGDRNVDLQHIRAFYSDIQARCPEKCSPIQFPPST
jgi:1-acyl-sn-glycerol-3-phosphate acyltransferase